MNNPWICHFKWLHNKEKFYGILSDGISYYVCEMELWDSGFMPKSQWFSISDNLNAAEESMIRFIEELGQ